MEIVVNTNNGVERQNKDFKYEYLKNIEDNTLSGIFAGISHQQPGQPSKIYWLASYLYILVAMTTWLNKNTVYCRI